MILDTNIYSAWGRKDEDIKQAVRRRILLKLPFFISAVSLFELRRGVAFCATPSRKLVLQQQLLMLQAAITPLPVSADDAILAAEIYAYSAAEKDKVISSANVADCLLAAQAINRHMPLVSRDRDFEHLDAPGLDLVRW